MGLARKHDIYITQRSTCDEELQSTLPAKMKHRNRPGPVLGPDIPYSNLPQTLPVIRGLPLTLGAIAISNLGFLQSSFYNSSLIPSLGPIKELDSYEAWFDPFVPPNEDVPSEPFSFSAASASSDR